MTTYTAIPDTDIDVLSPITESLLTLLRDNAIAITEGASGAPRIVNAAIDAAAAIETSKLAEDAGITNGMMGTDVIGQAQLKKAFQDITTASDSSGAESDAAFTGGLYQLGLEAKIQSTTGGPHSVRASWHMAPTVTLNTEAHIIFTTTSTSKSATGRFHYFNSSPPYDLGDGDIPLFLYVMVDTNGDVVCYSMAEDPPWVNNGPTITLPQFFAAGKPYRTSRNMSTYPLTLQQALQTPATLQQYIDAFNSADVIAYEITDDIKNADMDLFPTVFSQVSAGGVDLMPTLTQVLVDPVSPVLQQLKGLRNEHDANELSDIINNYLIIDNVPLVRKGPAGAFIPSIKWRNTKR